MIINFCLVLSLVYLIFGLSDLFWSYIYALQQIGRTLGYSFSLIKTSTELHGIPQRRIRTFYFFWQSPTVPMLQYQTRWKKQF